MKFTLGWLRDHLDTDASVTEIADALTDLGLEVEAVVDPGAALAPFRVVRVIEAVPHPNADRLRLCRVETRPGGPGTAPEEVQVVCGAPNARTGMAAVFAPVGAVVPGLGVTLKAGTIRGVESRGMLCSARELRTGDDHEGIIELGPEAEVGTPYAAYAGLDDPMIHIKVTPNRPDALGVRGIARDLAARGLGMLRPEWLPAVAGTYPCPVAVRVDDDLLGGGCPVFAGRVIRGVTNGASPEWMQRRLRAIGLRPISALVDITNFLTYDRNRPLHVFDAGVVQGGLRVHAAAGGESLLALDGRTYALRPGMILISDDAGPESLAGVMGGEASGVTAATRDVFVESALWDPLRIAATGRALRISTDARYRFERGVDPAFALPGLDVATALILEICGGEASEVAIEGAVPAVTRSYAFDAGRVRRLVGMDIPEADQRATLEALGVTLTGTAATPPSWRPDILGDVDLVEEIARVASLSRLEGRPMPRQHPSVPAPVLTPEQRREGRARRALAALGLAECVTYSFIGMEAARQFGGGEDTVRVDNPISSEMTHLRPDLLPGLLQAAARNAARGATDLGLFEVGPVFSGGEPGEQSVQAAAVITGATVPRGPHGARRMADPFDAKAAVEAVLAALGAPAKTTVLRGAAPWWHPARSGRIALGLRAMATFGEVHPRIVRAMGLKGAPVGFTIDLAAVPMPRLKGPGRPALASSDLQPVERDFAFVLDARVEAQTVVNAAAAADKALVASVTVFDVFGGPSAAAQFGEGRKSLAITVRLAPTVATLTDAEITTVSERIVAKVAAATGGALRS